MKVKIDKSPHDASQPFSHLIPIINVLCEAGNQAVYSEVFKLDKDGWYCLLRDKINFELIKGVRVVD